MQLTQTRTIDAPRERVWQALNDPQTLKACVPGCEGFEPDGENAYRATVLAKVGPVSARFSGRLSLDDIDPPSGYTLKFEGQGGAAGFANGNARVALASVNDGQTSLSYTVQAQVGGKLAQIGNRLVDGAAAKLADDFFARFAQALAPSAEIATQAPASAPAAASDAGRWVRVLATGALIALLVYLYLSRAG